MTDAELLDEVSKRIRGMYPAESQSELISWSHAEKVVQRMSESGFDFLVFRGSMFHVYEVEFSKGAGELRLICGEHSGICFARTTLVAALKALKYGETNPTYQKHTCGTCNHFGGTYPIDIGCVIGKVIRNSYCEGWEKQ